MASLQRPIFLWEHTREVLNELLHSADTFLFDLDGVIWEGEKILPGAREFLTLLVDSKKAAIFISNNSTKSRHFLVDRFAKFGISVEKTNVYTSSYAAAAYLKERNFNSKVYVLGGSGIQQELEEEGIASIGGETDGMVPPKTFSDVFHASYDPHVGAVVTGLDVNLNYGRLAAAHLHITRGALFIATNADVNFPYAIEGHDRLLLPGAGSILAALEMSTKQKAIILGKPNSFFLDLITREHAIDKAKTIFIGDNLHTDISFAANLGIRSVFVTGGVSKLEDMEKFGIFPTYVSQGVAGLL